MGSATTNLNSLIMKGRPEMTKHIAIIGGGYLGFRLAKAMENKANVTLIEPRSHFVHSIFIKTDRVATDTGTF
jgi:NADH dehydrogenase FAD-containing subunit